MFDSGGYKRMGGRPQSKNTQYFLILIALVVFFGLTYLYYTASNEAAVLQRELYSQSEHVMKLKNEILEGNVNLEKARSSESACQGAKSQLERKNEQCSTDQIKFKAQISDLETSISEKEESIRVLNQQLTEKTRKLDEDAIQDAAMRDAGIGQAVTITKLNETIELLKKELALKDDIIHGLRNKLGLSDTPITTQPNQTQTVPPVKQEAINVIPVPNRPDEPDHLSELEKPQEEEEKAIQTPGAPANDEVKNIDGGANVIRSPQDRLRMEQAQEEDEDDDKGPLLDAAKEEKF